jgi:hypothetical protein
VKVIRPALAGIALCGRSTSSTTGKHRGRRAARPDPANIKILAGDVIEAVATWPIDACNTNSIHALTALTYWCSTSC